MIRIKIKFPEIFPELLLTFGVLCLYVQRPCTTVHISNLLPRNCYLTPISLWLSFAHSFLGLM